MKRTWLILLAILAAPAAVHAQLTFVTNADNTIAIIGYTGAGGVVNIPSTTNGLPVTIIGEDAFLLQHGVTSVTIPGSVTSIESDAFGGCNSLTNATLSNGVASIEAGAFDDCYSLPKVTIPGSVTNIGIQAFTGCDSLTTIQVDAQSSFYSSVDGVLFDKSQSTLIQFPGGVGGSYTIPGSVTSIAAYAFQLCVDLTNVTIGDGVTNIGMIAFLGCYGLPSVRIPGSVTSIGEYAFEYCNGLTNVTIADGVASIGIVAFASCSSLTRVTIPGSVTTIGKEAFQDCSSLSSIAIPASVTNFGAAAFAACGSLTNITIANGVTTIGEEAFGGCSALTNITIPASVTNMGEDAFVDCRSLAGVYFQGNAAPADSSMFYNDTNATAYYLPGTSGWGDFSTNTGLPAVLWNPLIQAGDASFGVRSNQFGFDITGTTNIPIVVETSANLAGPVWTPLQTLTLTNGLFHFSDPQWTNYSWRFYRISSP